MDNGDGLLEYEELEVEPADFTLNGLDMSHVLLYHPMLWSKNYTASRSSTAHHNLEMLHRSERITFLSRPL
jgi:hypothetical protein